MIGWTRSALYINLELSDGELLVQMKPKGRYNIRVAQRHGVSVVEDVSSQGERSFFGTLSGNVRSPRSESQKQRLFRHIDPPSGGRQTRFDFLFAEYQGVRLATALVVYWGSRATYFFGGSRNVFRNVMAAYVLHYEVMRKAKRLGHQWYDMYGIAPRDRPDHAWANFSDFKRRFGGGAGLFVAGLDLRSSAYERYQEYRKSPRRKTVNDSQG